MSKKELEDLFTKPPVSLPRPKKPFHQKSMTSQRLKTLTN